MFLPDALARLNFLTTGLAKEENEEEEEEKEAIGKSIREMIIRRSYLTINASLLISVSRSRGAERRY